MTPDLKKIAAEIIGIADHIRERFPACASVLKTHAEALDPTPSMGIEEAIQVAREWAKTEILGTGPIVDALSVIVAHYEATKGPERKPDSESLSGISAPGKPQWSATTRAPGELVIRQWEKHALDTHIALYEETHGNYTAEGLRSIRRRCVVRP